MHINYVKFFMSITNTIATIVKYYCNFKIKRNKKNIISLCHILKHLLSSTYKVLSSVYI